MTRTPFDAPPSGRPHVVVVGGGFGGLYAAKGLTRAPVDVTLIDRRNFHLFQPLLYQVATGGLSPADIAAPLRRLFRRATNVRVLMAEVTGLDLAERRVVMGERALVYDHLVLAPGSVDHYFGHDEWAPLAPGLKTIEDATEMRRRVLRAFEQAERCEDGAEQEALLTFVVVGAGPTGVELAGAIAELAKDTLKRDFRSIDPTRSKVLLLEGSDRVLPAFPPDLSNRAHRSLRRLGVTVQTSTMATDIAPDGVTVRSGAGVTTPIPARTVLWGAGVRASGFGATLADQGVVTLDGQGRVPVEGDLTVPGHPDVSVIGDLARVSNRDGNPLPALAAVAMQQGRYVAKRIRRGLRGRALKPFRYWNRGSLATIGRAAAVADFGRLRVAGYPAWLVWLFVHIMYLVGFENRLLVLIQWAWNYVTRNRAARLITSSPMPYGRSDPDR